MDSFFARNRLSAYLDRILPKSEAEAVAEAVARDMTLSADLRAMKQALTLLESTGPVTAPPGFKARTMAVIAQQPVPGSQVAWLHRRLARLPMELIAVVGAGLIVIAALSTRTSDTAPVATAPAKMQKAAPAKAPIAVPASTPQPEVEAAKVSAPKVSPPAPNAKPKTGKATSNISFDPATPMGFRILHGGDQVLYDIATLADETSGRLVDVHGKLVTPHSLNEARSFSQLYLVTPSETAPAAHKKLLKRSGMDPYPLDGPQPPLNVGEAVFLIEAQL